MNTDFKPTYQSFTSKSVTIRRADDIVRKLNNEYPRMSKTIFEDMDCAKNFPIVSDMMDYKTFRVRSAISTRRIGAKTIEEAIKALPNSITRHKTGNCFESAELCALATKTNGIKDFRIGRVVSSEKGDLDHAVILVNNGKKPYVLDAWLGFADYLSKATERFKKEYSKHFNLSGTKTEKIFVAPLEHKSYQEEIIADSTTENLQKIFPELVVK